MWRFRDRTTTRDNGTKMKQRGAVLARQQRKAYNLTIDERTAVAVEQRRYSHEVRGPWAWPLQFESHEAI